MLAQDVKTSQRFTIDNNKIRGSCVKIDTGFFSLSLNDAKACVSNSIFVIGQDNVLRTVWKLTQVTLIE